MWSTARPLGFVVALILMGIPMGIYYGLHHFGLEISKVWMLVFFFHTIAVIICLITFGMYLSKMDEMEEGRRCKKKPEVTAYAYKIRRDRHWN